MNIEAEIRREAQRLIVRHEVAARKLSEAHQRRSQRTSRILKRPKPRTPPRWEVDPGFDPYVVRNRATTIAHSVNRALTRGDYEPRAPIAGSVSKPSGGSREISIYQVADSAVSKGIYETVLRHNLPNFSARSYAYRQDRTAQTAIDYIKREFAEHTRLYVAEYDFSKYFDHIEHAHIQETLDRHFVVGQRERRAIDGFLRVGPSKLAYDAVGPRRTRGIPQGTSISLLLANVAAWELDRQLEREGVGFVRYADDTLIWSTSYSRLCSAVEVLHANAKIIGVSVNAAKSPGISLLVPEEVEGEMRSVDHVSYLGHRIGLSDVSIRLSAELKLKRRINELIFSMLLEEPLRGTQHPRRLTLHTDLDYLSLIVRLRRYLYGDLQFAELQRFLRGQAPLRSFRGALSTYHQVNNRSALRALDDWLTAQLWLALKKRAGLLAAAGFTGLPKPHGLSRRQLESLTLVDGTGNGVDASPPRFSRLAGRTP